MGLEKAACLSVTFFSIFVWLEVVAPLPNRDRIRTRTLMFSVHFPTSPFFLKVRLQNVLSHL